LFNSGRRLAAGAATRPNDKSLVLQFECRLFVDLPTFIDPLANGHVAPKADLQPGSRRTAGSDPEAAIGDFSGSP